MRGRLDEVSELVNVAFDLWIGSEVAGPVCALDRVQVVLPEVVLLDIEGDVSVARLMVHLANVVLWRAEAEVPAIGHTIAISVRVERVDYLVEVVQRFAIPVSKVLAIHQEYLTSAPCVLLLPEVVH